MMTWHQTIQIHPLSFPIFTSDERVAIIAMLKHRALVDMLLAVTWIHRFFIGCTMSDADLSLAVHVRR